MIRPALILALLAMLSTGILHAQRFSATANFSSFDINKIDDSGTTIDYAGSSSVGLNLRLFNQKRWALRVGAGVDNLSYTVGNGVQTDYSARRQDLKGIFGVEKHFVIGNFLDLYPGAYVPLVVVGDDIVDVVNSNYQNIDNGTLRSGLGVVLGANVKLFKILRVGVEWDASYDNFKEGVWKGVQEMSFVPVRGINHTTAFTVGVAF
ncbi:MAG: hypothetical protein NW241_05020 [Bacteroidia bacterium]|nr:hypothetical protein [Bacteroidia bacterium]